jgi:hypothetical protein
MGFYSWALKVLTYFDGNPTAPVAFNLYSQPSFDRVILETTSFILFGNGRHRFDPGSLRRINMNTH